MQRSVESSRVGCLHASQAAVAIAAVASALAMAAVVRQRRDRQRQRTRRIRSMAEAVATESSTKTIDMHSPFEDTTQATEQKQTSEVAEEKPKLPLTLENVETVLDELRPYLRSDGGDCKIVEIDGNIVKLELQGSCSSCSASSVTLKMGIERTLKERIPEVSEVIAVSPDEEPLSQEGVEEVLNGIRPFLSVSGGTIDLHELVDGMNPRLVLKMKGPPLKSMAVRVEIINRIKRRFPLVQDVDIVGSEEEAGEAPVSA